ncbi:MAG: serine hydrolase domain-containing protein, partial [Pseudomonadota bacterium]
MAWIKAALCATIFLFCHGAVAQEPAEASSEAAPLQEQGLEAPSSVDYGSAEAEAPGSEPVDAVEDASVAAGDEAEGRDYDTFIKGVVLAITERFDVAGVSAAVVENGEVASLYAWGYADAERTKPITSDGSLMRLASVSKTFTWTALAQLVHEGKIDLDKDVNAYLTEIEVPEAFGVPVTLRHVIAHQAGFEDQGLGLRPTRTDVSLVEHLSKQVPRRMRAPGTAVSYSNWATGLAGRIIENVEGKPFNDVIKERIFKPTGMTRSTFLHELPGELAPLMPESAVRENGQWLSSGMPVIFGEEAAGSLRATGADMARYMIMHLNE